MPPDTAAARALLAVRQGALVAAILDGTPAPAGFGADALARARHVVSLKHTRHRRHAGNRLTRLRRSLVLSIVRFVIWLRAWVAPRL